MLVMRFNEVIITWYHSTNPGKIPTKLRRSVTGRKRPPQPEAAACSVTTDPPPYANVSTTGGN